MLRIGLSYDEGTPEYALYALALITAGSRFGFGVEPVWLAGRDKVFKPNALDDFAAVVLTGGADVGPQHYGFTGDGGVCRSIPDRDVSFFWSGRFSRAHYRCSRFVAACSCSTSRPAAR